MRSVGNAYPCANISSQALGAIFVQNPAGMLRIFVHSMFVADSESGQTEFVCSNSPPRTLEDILNEVTGGEKRVLSTMIDETGRFRPHVAIFVGNEQQRNLKSPDMSIGENVEEVSIFPALSGG